MKTLVRQNYLEKIERYITSPTVIAVIGLRRVGKSVLLRQLAEQLRSLGSVVYIDKENFDFNDIRNAGDIISYVGSHSKKGERTFVIIDEIQLIENWETAVASLNGDEGTSVVISGSNATLFAGELATRLAGRYTTLRVLPLSLREFTELRTMIHDDVLDERVIFESYRSMGGLPGLLHTDLSPDLIAQMQRDIYSTIALRDVIARRNIRDVNAFQSISTFAMDNVGSLISAKRISDYLKSEGRKGSTDTVLNYLSYLCDAFIFDRVDRFDIRGKRLLQVNSKYFLGDLGLRTGMLGHGDSWIAGDLENLVYHELLRRGYRIFIGVYDKMEIDFIITGPEGNAYIQVSYLIEREETRDREIKPLLATTTAFPKFLLTLDPVTPGGLAGIRHMNIIEFLKGKPLFH
jgi:predicted AAA+ superfamily ATPase